MQSNIDEKPTIAGFMFPFQINVAELADNEKLKKLCQFDLLTIINKLPQRKEEKEKK